MKAVLDHVGIAVKDLQAALAFYRDALGLEIDAPEEVVSQRVRARFVPVGESRLELLEATAADSPIARYLEKRGPGLHHITLRVEDISAALAQLKARGVRLIDEQPRPGAEGALVAFVHPSSAHGVLVELKQSAELVVRQAHHERSQDPLREVHHERSQDPFRHADHERSRDPLTLSPSKGERDDRVRRYTIGDIELISVCDGFIRVDGGSMFGVVPKTLWSANAPADERNRITLAMRPLIVRGARTMLIGAGLGDKESETFQDIYGVDRARNLDQTLAEAGIAPEAIDIVLASHLHFDHAGGFTVRDASGRAVMSVKGQSQQIDVALGPNYRAVVVYAPSPSAPNPSAQNRTFICFEPMASITDALNLAQRGLYKELQSIPPGQTWEERFWVRPSGF